MLHTIFSNFHFFSRKFSIIFHNSRLICQQIQLKFYPRKLNPFFTRTFLRFWLIYIIFSWFTGNFSEISTNFSPSLLPSWSFSCLNKTLKISSSRKTSASLAIQLLNNLTDDVDANWQHYVRHRHLLPANPASTTETISCPTWASSTCQCHTQLRTFQFDRA